MDVEITEVQMNTYGYLVNMCFILAIPAILLVGFASGGRRSNELAAVNLVCLLKDGAHYLFNLDATKTTTDEKDNVKPIKRATADAFT